jgi:hypothetical protein
LFPEPADRCRIDRKTSLRDAGHAAGWQNEKAYLILPVRPLLSRRMHLPKLP